MLNSITTNNDLPSGRFNRANVVPFLRKSKRDSLPVIDLSEMEHPNPRIQRIAAQRIGEVAMGNGFLYISDHGVSNQLLDNVYAQAKIFFDQPQNTKNRYYIGNSATHRGYVPVSEKGDYADESGPRLYEAFDMGFDLDKNDPEACRGNPLLGPNVWPDQRDFHAVLSQYFQQVQRIGHIMCQAFEIALDLPQGFFRSQMKKPISQLRLLHYLENNEVRKDSPISMGAHTDYECFTLLHSRTPSLQILDLDSQWIDAPPLKNTFYFNIGDMLEVWSGGLLVATPHRVINRGEERFSIPYFAATNYDTIVSPVSCAKYSSKQREYAPIVAGDHLLSQLIRDFPYLRKRYQAGLIQFTSVHPQENPFENRIRQAAT